MDKRQLPPSALEQLKRDLEQLKLRTLERVLEPTLETAQKTEQGYITFLAELVKQEKLARMESATIRRLKAAGFPVTRTFDQFDWTFQAGLNVQLVKDLMNLHFITAGRPVLLLGRPGVGKTHLMLAFGHLAVHHGFSVRFFNASRLLELLYAALADASLEKVLRNLSRVDLLLIDDLREIPPRPEYASLLFDLVDSRYQSRSLMLSSNLSVNTWGKALGNPPLVAALVDRLMERAHIINIRRGRSYRLEGPEAPAYEQRPEELSLGPADV
jgi:DNA replication protein DnaC